MKTYFLTASFAKPIEKFAIPYLIFTILTVVFSTSIWPWWPLLTLFNNSGPQPLPPKPASYFDIFKVFNYYASLAQYQIRRFGTLKFVCLVIITSVFLGTDLPLPSERTMENLRIHTLLNLVGSF
jgi:subfamily B ATP-binding cassette protein MsbA